MGKILKLRAPESNLEIGNNTLIGRSAEISDSTLELDLDLELALNFPDTIGNRKVSGNHCAIIREGDQFYVIDLGSTNGTYVNKQKLRSKAKVPLVAGMSVQFHPDLAYRVQIEDSPTNSHALLVGHPGDDIRFFGRSMRLRGIETDLNYLTEALVQSGFRGNITRLFDEQATKANTLSALERIAEETHRDRRLVIPHTIFTYSGHGMRGLSLNDSRLTPEELYERIERIKGKKAVILDTCEAGYFLEGDIPLNTLVIAATRSEKPAYEVRVREETAGIIQATDDGDTYMGVLMKELINYFRLNQEDFNLAGFKHYIDENRDRFAHKYKFQSPIVAGPTFTMIVPILGNGN